MSTIVNPISEGLDPMPAIDAVLPDEALDHIADTLWAKMVGANCDPVDLNLRVCPRTLCAIA
jgi:hypothetical protein